VLSTDTLLIKQILVGIFHPSEDFNGHCSRDGYHLEADILFQNAFMQEPNIVVWLCCLPHVRRDQEACEFSVKPTDITKNGFKMTLQSLHEGLWTEFRVAWLAYPAYIMHVQSGTCKVTRSGHNVIQRREFAMKFERIPRVFLAFSGLYVEDNEAESLEVKVLHTDEAGFFWSCFDREYVDLSMPTSSMVAADVQWVAFGDRGA
jgi:hypothetical protein